MVVGAARGRAARPTWPGWRWRTPPRPGAGPAARRPCPTPPAAGVDQDRLARPQAGQVDQPVVGGQEHHGHGGGLRERPVRRASGRAAARSVTATGPKAPGTMPEHPVAGRRGRSTPGADLEDDAGAPRCPAAPSPGYMPRAISTSRKFSPAARTAIRTSSAPSGRFALRGGTSARSSSVPLRRLPSRQASPAGGTGDGAGGGASRGGQERGPRAPRAGARPLARAPVTVAASVGCRPGRRAGNGRGSRTARCGPGPRPGAAARSADARRRPRPRRGSRSPAASRLNRLVGQPAPAPGRARRGRRPGPPRRSRRPAPRTVIRVSTDLQDLGAGGQGLGRRRPGAAARRPGRGRPATRSRATPVVRCRALRPGAGASPAVNSDSVPAARPAASCPGSRVRRPGSPTAGDRRTGRVGQVDTRPRRRPG